ncbi:DUF3805 domain-containing protein [Pontibacter beigongshangensis]|uniref:DUF3805 domain-containing protein n=1 Tax=Pontibacter beigongshangensis TaxID=2574733 RepID=UPI0016505240|nr:DUF3805 domain-containing protein [Pontibacter beigongshangensis]
MEFREFTSEQEWFIIKVPSNWEEFPDGKGTYAFYDEDNWTGNFRITPLKWDNLKGIDKSPEYLTQEYEENISKNPKRLKLGAHDCVFYKEYLQEEENEVLMYNWTLGSNNTLFLISFSTDKANEGTEENEKEMEKIEYMIGSLQIH